MATNSTPKKRIDSIDDLTKTERQACSQRAVHDLNSAAFIGIDATGALHYFSKTTRRVAVYESVADTDPLVVDLAETPLDDTPRAWGEHVCEKRGLWREFRVGIPRRAAELEQ